MRRLALADKHTATQIATASKQTHLVFFFSQRRLQPKGQPGGAWCSAMQEGLLKRDKMLLMPVLAVFLHRMCCARCSVLDGLGVVFVLCARYWQFPFHFSTQLHHQQRESWMAARVGVWHHWQSLAFGIGSGTSCAHVHIVHVLWSVVVRDG
jgi:hypothetical protein